MSKPQGSILDDHIFDGFRLDADPFKDGKEEIGKGTYGTVYKVNYRGAARAAREFYPRGRRSSDKKDSLKKYQRYAQVPQHNNIVQVLGVYGRKAVGQPEVLPMILVMELMDCSLNTLLERGSEFSNSTKLSILLDVSLGLKFLHCQDPPIAHYYLSSNNVLLTAERKAKISDIGVAQMIAYKNENQLSQKGLPFMAPELRKSNANGPPADVFSFGVVMLHTVTEKQIAAAKIKQPEFHFQSQCDQIAADSFFKQLSELVRSCLLNDLRCRPQISLISQFIENLTKSSDLTKSPTTSADHAGSPVTSHGHDEAHQTLRQAQPNDSIADVGSKPFEFTTAKYVPSLPYKLENHGPKVIGFQNLGNTCFFNSMLQCINQTVDLHYAITRGKRVYLVENSIEGLLPVEVAKPSHGVTSTLQSFLSGVNRHYNTISPHNLLHALGRNNYRFGRGTQEDSHEVLRCLLSGLREEEINCIRQGVYSHYNVSQNFLKDRNVDGETKLSIKEYLSKVSKGVCDIDCTFGVEIVTTTICHECQTPLQLKEFCLDLALPMPPHNVTQMNDGRHGSVVTSKEKFNKHLKKKKLHYHDPLPGASFKTQLEGSLWAFTKLDVLDDKNKFICHSCSNAHNFQITQCRVSKQILIHKLSPVLILQMKRFTIGSHNVTKDNQHVSFPRVLDMGPYCTAECLEDYADSKGKILYGLYAIVVHSGSLNGGHYTACVRQRPLRKNLSKQQQPDVSQQTYNAKAAEDGQWYYTSDSHISGCGFDSVKNSQAYLLFYELLPGNEYLREAKRNRKATKDQNKIDEVDEIANKLKESITDDIDGLNKLQTKVDEISLEIKERKSSCEDALQKVENLHTKYQQIVKQQQEDQASQAATFESEAKNSNDKIVELENELIRNAAINKDKVKGLEEEISDKNAEVEKLKVAVKEAEDSYETVEKEYQQTLEQQKTESAKEKKVLQDTLTEKDMDFKKSEEGRLALEKKYQQALEQLEQFKIGKLQLLANKATALLDQSEEPVKHDDSHSNEENKQTLDQSKERDARNSHDNFTQPASAEHRISDEALENDKKQESDKENRVSLGKPEQQGINEEQGVEHLENNEHQQAVKLHENEEQQINIERQHSSGKQEHDPKKESTVAKQQSTDKDGDQRLDVHQTEDGDQQQDAQNNDPDQQQTTGQITENGNQQGCSKLQNSSDNQQETDNLTKKDPGKLGKNQKDDQLQQDNNSGKDLEDQQVQHVDENDYTHIVPVATGLDMHTENSTTEETSTYIAPTKSSSDTHEENSHKMGYAVKNNPELPISKQQRQPDQVTGADNQQQATDHETHQQPVEKQKTGKQQLYANKDTGLLDQSEEPIKHDDSQSIEKTKQTLDQYKEHNVQSSHDNGSQPVSAEQKISEKPLENDKKQGSHKENSGSLRITEQLRINEEQGDEKHSENDECQQTDKLQDNEEQQTNIEQLQLTNDKKEDDAMKKSTVTKLLQSTDQDKDDDQQHDTDPDKDSDQPQGTDQGKDPYQQYDTDQTKNGHQQPDTHQDKVLDQKLDTHKDPDQHNVQIEDGDQQGNSLQQKSQPETDDLTMKDPGKLGENQNDDQLQQDNNSRKDLEGQQVQHVDENNCTLIVPVTTGSDIHTENSTTGETSTCLVPTKSSSDTPEEYSHKMGNTEKNNQELPISKQQHQPDQITEAGNQQQATDHKVHQQPVKKQKNQREQNNDGQSVNDRQQNGDNEPLKQQQPQEDSEQQSGHHGEQQKNDEQQVDNNDCKKQEESQQSCSLSQPDNQHKKDSENKQIDGNKCTKIKVEGIDSDKTCKENNTTREDCYIWYPK